VDLPVRHARYDRDRLAVNVEPEGVVVGSHGDDLAGVDHADMDALGGDHDATSLGYPPLHRYRPECWCWHAGCAAGSAQPVPVSRRDGAGQGRVRSSSPSTLMTAIWVPSIRQGDALAGELVADVRLPAGETDQADAVDHPLYLDRHAVAGRQGRGSGKASSVGG
jgi:hypothetical protein